MSNPTPVRAGEDAGREAMKPVAWLCDQNSPWGYRTVALMERPHPNWAANIEPLVRASAAEAEVARLIQERDEALRYVQEWREKQVADLDAVSAHILVTVCDECRAGVDAVEAEASALRERVARLEEANANLHIAFMVLSESGHGGGMHEVRHWYNSGTGKPIPWPSGAIFAEWAAENGIVKRNGAMAFRAALTEGGE